MPELFYVDLVNLDVPIHVLIVKATLQVEFTSRAPRTEVALQTIKLLDLGGGCPRWTVVAFLAELVLRSC